MTGLSQLFAELRVHLPDPDASDAFGRRLAGALHAGDVVLLAGPIGAGKSQVARAAIRSLLARAGAEETDIPSPTYTLVQTYDAGEVEIWHADLYRLSAPDEVCELGLDLAFDSAICLVEWPDRLGDLTPPGALSIRLDPDRAGEGRIATLRPASDRWAPVLRDIQHAPDPSHDTT